MLYVSKQSYTRFTLQPDLDVEWLFAQIPLTKHKLGLVFVLQVMSRGSVVRSGRLAVSVEKKSGTVKESCLVTSSVLLFM